MPDVGFTHVALPVTNLDASVEFYAKYTGLRVVHRRARALVRIFNRRSRTTFFGTNNHSNFSYSNHVT